MRCLLFIFALLIAAPMIAPASVQAAGMDIDGNGRP
jgi:hypothetical protein